MSLWLLNNYDLLLFFVFGLSQSGFQTGWFLESLATQTLVIYIIRTKKIPFVDSWPSKYLLFSTLFCVAFGWIIPYTPIGDYFGFTQLPIKIILTLIGIIAFYLVTIEFTKRIFYKTHDF